MSGRGPAADSEAFGQELTSGFKSPAQIRQVIPFSFTTPADLDNDIAILVGIPH